MKCKSCGAEIDNDDLIIATIADHDENLIDLIVECPECNARLHTFIDMREMQSI